MFSDVTKIWTKDKTQLSTLKGLLLLKIKFSLCKLILLFIILILF